HRTGGAIPVYIATGLAIAEIKVIKTIRPFDDIRGPKIPELYLIQGWHLHAVVVPVYKIITVPYRGDPRSQHLIVRGGIDIIQIPEFFDGGVGKIARNHGVDPTCGNVIFPLSLDI